MKIWIAALVICTPLAAHAAGTKVIKGHLMQDNDWLNKVEPGYYFEIKNGNSEIIVNKQSGIGITVEKSEDFIGESAGRPTYDFTQILVNGVSATGKIVGGIADNVMVTADVRYGLQAVRPADNILYKNTSSQRPNVNTKKNDYAVDLQFGSLGIKGQINCTVIENYLVILRTSKLSTCDFEFQVSDSTTSAQDSELALQSWLSFFVNTAEGTVLF